MLATASAAGLLTGLGNAPYSVTKHAAVAFAEWLAITYGDRGIKVSCLCPQGVRTDDARGRRRRPGGGRRRRAGRGRARGRRRWPTPWSRVLRDERFLILPHPEVADYEQRRAADRDRWLAGMRRFQASLLAAMPRLPDGPGDGRRLRARGGGMGGPPLADRARRAGPLRVRGYRATGVVADLGTGPGWYAAALRRPVVALDAAGAMLRRARHHAPERRAGPGRPGGAAVRPPRAGRARGPATATSTCAPRRCPWRSPTSTEPSWSTPRCCSTCSPTRPNRSATTSPAATSPAGREARLRDVVVGAGFTIDALDVDGQAYVVRATRAPAPRRHRRPRHATAARRAEPEPVRRRCRRRLRPARQPLLAGDASPPGS